MARLHEIAAVRRADPEEAAARARDKISRQAELSRQAEEVAARAAAEWRADEPKRKATQAERARSEKGRTKWSRIRLASVVVGGLGLALYINAEEVVRLAMAMGKVLGVMLLAATLFVGLMYVGHVLMRRLRGSTCCHPLNFYWPWSVLFPEKAERARRRSIPESLERLRQRGYQPGTDPEVDGLFAEQAKYDRSRNLRATMKTPLKVLSAAALILVVLFLAPVVYRTGQRWGLYLSCPGDPDYCWGASGMAVLHGGRLPRR